MPEEKTSRLFIWPKGSERTPEVKRIVESLSLDYTVKPFWWTPGKSEGVSRILVLEEGFEYGTVVDYIFPRKESLVQEAVEWALGLRESRGAHTVRETMERIFGEGVTIWDDVHMPEWDKEWPNV